MTDTRAFRQEPWPHDPTPGRVPERSFRSAGCGEGCRVVSALLVGVFGRSDLLLHDPEQHERFGRRQAGADTDAPVRTGWLTVDIDDATILVSGRPVVVTATEARLLFTLARRVGRLVQHPELAVAVWGLGILEEPEPYYRHAVRVNMARLRRRIHPLEGMISTVPAFGYRLELLPESAPPPPSAANQPLRSDRWARIADACVVCGRSDLPHQAHGRCTSCYQHHGVRPGRGRVGYHRKESPR